MSTTEFAAFETLDLAPIKMKLMHVESGEGWSAARANAVEAEYRRFLFLMKQYPEAEASPTVDVDTFWHYHILDTMKYARDCDQVFGYFLHHYPYVGIGAEADAAEQVQAGERMRGIYEAEFGAAGAAQSAWCTAPGKKLEGANEASAWCTAPGKKLEGANEASAWCTAPSKPAGASTNQATAWCTAPSKPAGACTNQATAWCTAPSNPAGASTNQVTAWCTAPSKPLPLAA